MDTTAIAAEKKKWSLLPGSVVSLAVHGLVLIVASISLRGCENGAPAEAGGQAYREVGLSRVPSNSEPSTEDNTTPQDDVSEQPSEDEEPPTDHEVIPTEAPNISELLNQSQSPSDAVNSESNAPEVIGIGIPLAGLPPAGMGIPDLIRAPRPCGVRRRPWRAGRGNPAARGRP